MKQRVWIAAILAAMFFTACSAGEGGGELWQRENGPETPEQLWTEVALSEPEQARIELVQTSGDVILEGAGSLLALLPLPEQDRQLLAVDLVDASVRLTLLDLNRLETEALGSVLLVGSTPVVADYSYPWLLFQTANSAGMFQWLLLDMEHWEIEWQHAAWVPRGMRRQPVWCHDDTWLLGPVSGPTITDVLTGRPMIERLVHSPLNPLSQPWPGWAGPAPASWFAYPAEGEEEAVALINLKTGEQLLFPAGNDLVWQSQGKLLAWTEESILTVASPGEEAAQPMGAQPVCSPLWSGEGEYLYYIAGSRDYLGITWNGLWRWQEKEGPLLLSELPFSMGRWQLLAASDRSVLARGDNSEVLVYFDLVETQHWELSEIEPGNWLWSAGNLFAAADGELLRLTPGAEKRVIARYENQVELIALVDNYLAFQVDEQVLIKQIILQGH